MRRKIQNFFTKSALESLRHLPNAMFRIKNWLPFVLNYAGFRDTAENYVFRGNGIINTVSGVDASSIYVVYFKKDYGTVYDKDIIIDIGANIGVFSLYAAGQSPGAIIYAYEPNLSNYRILKKNISKNALQSRILAHNIGVAAEKGIKKLFIADSSPYHSIYQTSEQQHFIEMSCCSLKDIFDENTLERCNLLKIDCEGAEFEILYNTPKEYFEKIDCIRMEYHNRDLSGYNIGDLTHFLKKRHFQMVHKDTNALIAWFDRRVS